MLCVYIYIIYIYRYKLLLLNQFRILPEILWQAVVFTSQKHGKFPGFQSWLSPSESGLRLTSQVHHGLDGCQAELCHRLQGFGPLQAGAAKVEVDELQGLAHHADLTGADESLLHRVGKDVSGHENQWGSGLWMVMISYDIHMFHVLSNQLRQVVCNKNACGGPAGPAAPRTSADQSPSPNRWSSPTATAARIRGNRHSTWATATAGVPWQLLSRGDILWEI